jgi:exopolysaccharide biosynthesis polyprenyl glycosylphosphotransferase
MIVKAGRDSGAQRRYSGGTGVVHPNGNGRSNGSNGSHDASGAIPVSGYDAPMVNHRVATATEADGSGAAQRLSSHTRTAKRVASFLRVCRYLDVVVVLTTLFGVFLLMNTDHPGAKGVQAFLQMRITVKNVLLLALFGVTMQISLSAFGLYEERRFADPTSYVLRLVAACLVGMTPIILFPMASSTGAFGPTTFAYFILATVTTLLALRAIIWIVATAPTTRLEERHVLIVGSGPRALRLYHELATYRGEDGIRIAGFVDTNPDPLADEIQQRMLGQLDQLESILMRQVIDDVLITLPIKSCYEQIQQTIALCERLGVRAAYLADVFQSSLARPTFEQTGQIPVVRMHMVANDTRLVIKRLIDIGLATVGLIMVSPILAVIALAIRLDGSHGPVIFAQERFGFNKRRFRMFKFRTMIADAEKLQSTLEDRNEAAGPVFKIKDDPRVTRIGKFLRKTSLDELPQLWNVLRGDMSLVGPRPLPLRDVHRFSESWLMRRFSVRPGVTGLWQVSGRSDLTFSRWVALDLQYIDRWSLGLDLKILAMTVPAVLKGRGAA